jgi:hypothetical protein
MPEDRKSIDQRSGMAAAGACVEAICLSRDRWLQKMRAGTWG